MRSIGLKNPANLFKFTNSLRPFANKFHFTTTKKNTSSFFFLMNKPPLLTQPKNIFTDYTFATRKKKTKQPIKNLPVLVQHTPKPEETVDKPGPSEAHANLVSLLKAIKEKFKKEPKFREWTDKSDFHLKPFFKPLIEFIKNDKHSLENLAPEYKVNIANICFRIMMERPNYGSEIASDAEGILENLIYDDESSAVAEVASKLYSTYRITCYGSS